MKKIAHTEKLTSRLTRNAMPTTIGEITRKTLSIWRIGPLVKTCLEMSNVTRASRSMML